MRIEERTLIELDRQGGVDWFAPGKAALECPRCGSTTKHIVCTHIAPGVFEVIAECGCPLADVVPHLKRLALARNGHQPLPHHEERSAREAGTRLPEPPPQRPRQQQRAPPKGYTARELMGMTLPDPKFAVPGYICQGFNLLAGGQKLGKSWLAFSIALAISMGGKALGSIDVVQGDVLYLALEDNRRRLQDRLKKLLAGEEPPDRLWIYNEWPRMGDGGLSELKKWLTIHREARLVIVDTLKKIRPPRVKGASIYDEDYEYAGDLKALADMFDVAILALHHVRKATAEDVFDMVSGSVGLTAAADATLVLERSRGRKEAALHVTGRDIEEKAQDSAMGLLWDEETGIWSLVGTREEMQQSDERKRIIELLKSAGKPLSPRDIADELEKNPNTTRVLLRKMVQQGQIQADGFLYTHTLNTVNSVNDSHDVNAVNTRGE